MVNPVLSRPSEVWMPSHRSRPIGNTDISGHRILASRSTIRQADSRDRPEPRTGGMESVPSISDPGRSRNVRTQFTPDGARRFYDRFGCRQDTQGFYENPALDDLVKYADFEHARSVLEFGCGTGSFARRLLETDLPVKAHYLGLDITSPPYRQERQGLRTTFSCVFEGFSRELTSHYIIHTNCNALYSPIHYRPVANM